MGLSINLATGQNAAGVIQSSGDQPDANWTVTNADSYRNSPIAYTVAPGNGDWYGGWLSNDATSTWIAANPDSSANGDLICTFRFNLTGYNPADASIVGGLATLDDIGVVLLNGHQIGSVAYNTFNQLHTLSSGAGDFVSGWNTLVIQITQSDNLYEGVRLEGTVVDSTPAGSAEHWKNPVNGKFTTASDWSGGALPGSSDDAILDASGASYTVSSSINETVNSIQTAANATLAVTGGTFAATGGTGSGANAGTITVGKATLTTGGTIQNTGGLIAANNGGIVNLSGTTLAGGTLKTAGTGIIDAGTSLSAQGAAPGLFDGTTSPLSIQGSVTVRDGYALTIEGTIQNAGTIAVDGSADATQLEVGSAGATLSAGGSLVLTDNANNVLAASGSGAVLTNVDNAISGAGSIGGGGLGLTNETSGVIDASGTNALTLATTGAVTNAGLLEATGSGGLVLGATAINNQGGTIAAGNGSEVTLAGATVTGGTLEAKGTGVIDAGSNAATTATFDGTSSPLSLAGSVVVGDGDQLALKGAIQNAGTISVEGSAHATQLVVGSGGVTLSGGGSIALSDNANNAISAAASGAVLTNVDNTIAGAGFIGAGRLGLTNEAAGIIDANGTIALTLSTTGAVTNAGLLEGTGAGGLTIRETTVNNAGGTISAGAGSRIKLRTADITGGTFATAGTGVITAYGTGNVLDGTASAVAVTGKFVVTAAASLTGQGEIDNSGVIAVAGTATLNGSLVNTGRLEVHGGSLTVADTVTGAGMAFINGGTLTFGAGFDESVAFNGSGTLVLADSQHYSHTIGRFSTSGTDSIDLRDIGFVDAGEATFSGRASGGILTVTDGTLTAHIALSGNYLSSTFVASSDNHGGVIITDPAVSQLTQAVAGFSARSGGLVSAQQPFTQAAQTPMLAAALH